MGTKRIFQVCNFKKIHFSTLNSKKNKIIFSGQFYRNIDYCVTKLKEEWKDFYPFALPNENDEKDDEPYAVELAIGDQNCAFKGKTLQLLPNKKRF